MGICDDPSQPRHLIRGSKLPGYVHVLHMFSHNRVNKKWNKLSKDKSAWTEIDIEHYGKKGGGLTGARVKRGLQKYGSAAWTENLKMSAKCERRRMADYHFDNIALIWVDWNEEVRNRKLATIAISIYFRCCCFL